MGKLQPTQFSFWRKPAVLALSFSSVTHIPWKVNSVGVTIAYLYASSWPFNLILISEGKQTLVLCLVLLSLYLNFACLYSADEHYRKIQIFCICICCSKMQLLFNYDLHFCHLCFSLVKHILLFFFHSELFNAASDISNIAAGMEFNEICKYRVDSFMWSVGSYWEIPECIMVMWVPSFVYYLTTVELTRDPRIRARDDIIAFGVQFTVKDFFL